MSNGYINYSYVDANQVIEGSNPRGPLNNMPRQGVPVGAPAPMSPYLNGNSTSPGFHDQGVSSATWGQTPGFGAFGDSLPPGYGDNPGVTEEGVPVNRTLTQTPQAGGSVLVSGGGGKVLFPAQTQQIVPMSPVPARRSSGIPWWVWALGAVIVVGGGTGAYVLLARRK